MIENDRRLLILNDFILVTNLKVGYSSLNKMRLTNNVKIDNPCNIISTTKKVIFIYRNSIERVISGFLFWTLGHNTRRTPEYKPFLREMPTTLSVYVELIKKYNNITEFNKNKQEIMINIFKIFLDNFNLFGWNPHYTNQSKIINHYNLKPDYLIELKNSTDEVKKITNIVFPSENINKRKNVEKSKNVLLLFLKNEPLYMEYLKKFYNDDIIFFSKYNIDIFTV